MKWGQILKEWENGCVMSYNIFTKSRFFYESSPYENDESEYEHMLIESNNLDNMSQDYTPFNEYINKNITHTSMSFYNLSKTSKLIIPMPCVNKNFTTLKDFIDNASIDTQKEFWKKVADEIRHMSKLHKKIWISTHGLGVGYLHMRIDTSPKYYHTDEFK